MIGGLRVLETARLLVPRRRLCLQDMAVAQVLSLEDGPSKQYGKMLIPINMEVRVFLIDVFAVFTNWLNR